MTQAALERSWRRSAIRLARRFNVAWWLERFNALLIGALPLFAVLLLVVRTWRPGWLAPASALALLLGTVGVVALAAWRLTARRFVGVEEGLASLDDRLGLHNRLASASAGVGPWPEPMLDPLAVAAPRWNVARAGLPGPVALLSVAAAWWMPLPEAKPVALAAAEPTAWRQMEDWLATMEEGGLVEEDSLRELASRVEELRDQPEEAWFGHSSLEATDALRQSLGMEIRDFSTRMAVLERQLSSLRSSSSRSEDGEGERLAERFREALEALGGGALPLDEALAKQLGGIDPAALAAGTLESLSAGQLEALQEQLGKGAGALGAMEGLPGLVEGGLDFGEGTDPFGDGRMGSGGLSRGRGDAPLFFGDEEAGLGTTNPERIGNDDVSRAAAGEVLGLAETEREIDRSRPGPVAGGSVESMGRGGEAVSREALLPEEQAVLKRYFK